MDICVHFIRWNRLGNLVMLANQDSRGYLLHFHYSFLTMTSTSLEDPGAFSLELTFLWFWRHLQKRSVRFLIWIFVTMMLHGFDWVLETMVHCRFNLRGPRVLQDVWLINCGLGPPVKIGKITTQGATLRTGAAPVKTELSYGNDTIHWR